MTQGRLLFTPIAGEPPSGERLIQALRRIGFVGAPLAGDGFLPGERFMQLLSFMGCSPFLRLEPTDDGSPFCQIRLTGPLPQPQAFPDAGGRPPRCPDCRAPLGDWQERLTGATVRCTACGTDLALASLAWGHHAGAGRLFLEVWEVYPGDGRPSEGLLAALKEAGGAPWHWFWQGGGINRL